MNNFKFITGLVLSFIGLSTVQAEMVPAIKYKGLVMSGNTLTANSCEFYVALEPGADALDSEFALVYAASVHGESIPPGVAEFFYFDPQAALGASFYPVDQPQDQNVLTMSSIVLRPTSPKFGSDVTPNDIPTLNQNRDIQTSMVLTFKEGLSFETYTGALLDLANDPNSALDMTVINAVDLMTVLLWHSGHYDRIRCANASFDSVTLADVDFKHTAGDADDHEDDHSHDHDNVDSKDEDHEHEDHHDEDHSGHDH